jgi:putative ABC transport system substrate-binding protein
MEPAFAAFLDRCGELGWVNGGNLRIEIRVAEGKPDLLSRLAAGLVAMKPDALVPVAHPPTRAAIAATNVIPIVMVSVDPIAGGFIDSLSHPGGNLTGVAGFTSETSAKRLQLLKDAAPEVQRVAVLLNLNDASPASVRETQRAARETNLETRFFSVQPEDDPTPAFNALLAWHPDAILLIPSGPAPYVDAMIALALQHKLVSARESVEAGGLISYLPDRWAMWRTAADILDKVLKGAKPGDIPVELPTRYELVVNLKTAKAIGLTIPVAILARADRVIE